MAEEDAQMEVEEAPAAEVEVVEMSVLDALKDVLKKALIHGGLKRGLREVAKALDSRSAKLCCLAKDCDNAEYSRLVRALCDESGVHLVMVDEGKQLGEWAGLCKIDRDGEATKVVRCSAAAVTEFGEDTHALSVLLNYLKTEAASA
ncbi:50S ribosomal protein L30e-like protein [Pelagophyceae sp. CCMP2097]|nr:50S ribosomal protein L30e-like protein [Pelagophyceae sp. CCMP2097]|eukprot:CAMPEP_0184089894 /NCGR_PEP_ID=MMETSP0974-20121125/6955_1 /TAXON_ID=483370 /ORGANISM="non described non described, Strain CCMP2097" /LENGTH=146 /DNA_ID=CAMNT_0026392611 /DNA_START=52 /DNA_END=492 /DNA_ORIENTATION=+